MPYDAQVRRISWVSRARPARGRYVASSSPLPAGRILKGRRFRRPFLLSQRSRSFLCRGWLRRPLAGPFANNVAELRVADRLGRLLGRKPFHLAPPFLGPALALRADKKGKHLDGAGHARPALEALLVAVGADRLAADHADDAGLLERFAGRRFVGLVPAHGPALGDDPALRPERGHEQYLDALVALTIGQGG